jgi:hypothetical protein
MKGSPMNPVTISLSAFQQALTSPQLLQLRILHVALGMGVAFLSIVVFILFNSIPATNLQPDLELLNILSLVNLFIVFSCVPLSKVLSEIPFKMFAQRSNQPQTDNSHTEEAQTIGQILSVIRTSHIIRLAVLEGVAFFGLVVCIIGATNGGLSLRSEYWLNGVPAIFYIIFVSLSIPSASRLEQLFINRFQQP